jgi:hypothetical protein
LEEKLVFFQNEEKCRKAKALTYEFKYLKNIDNDELKFKEVSRELI